MKELTVLTVSFKTPELINIVIDSFEKFKPKDLNIKYIVVENSTDTILSQNKKITLINNKTDLKNSDANGIGIEIGKKNIETDWTFVCHSDVCVTSDQFFIELQEKINEGYNLIAHVKDNIREHAAHISGILIKTEILKLVSTMPQQPDIDVGDTLTLYCKHEKQKYFIFENTYNDGDLVEEINEPFKSWGTDCGIDRCIDKNNNVKFIHFGRGTPKYFNSYSKPRKKTFKEWQQICKTILE